MIVFFFILLNVLLVSMDESTGLNLEQEILSVDSHGLFTKGPDVPVSGRQGP